MKREDFFAQLFSNLDGLSAEERSKIEEYYTELLMDELEEGVPEEEAISHFGNPGEVAGRIKDEHEVKDDMKERLPVNTGPIRRDGVYQAKGEITSFQISAQDVSVQIYPALDGKFKILYRKSPKEEVSVWEDQGQYIFRQEIPLRYRIFSFGKWGREGIRVEVPENKIRNFQVTTSNATVKAENLRGFEDGRLYTSNARITLQNIEGNRVETKSSNGGIHLELCKTKQLDAQTSNSGIFCGESSSQRVFLKTSNGRIHIRRLISEDIKLRNSNASIKGSICGDVRTYAMDCHTSNGSCNLPNWKDVQCTNHLYAHTSNASIKIDFTD